MLDLTNFWIGYLSVGAVFAAYAIFWSAKNLDKIKEVQTVEERIIREDLLDGKTKAEEDLLFAALILAMVLVWPVFVYSYVNLSERIK